MELGLPRRYLQRRFLPSGISPHDIRRRSTRFLTILKQQKHCQLGLRGQRGDEMKVFRFPKFYRQETDMYNYSSANTYYPSWRRKDDFKGRALSPESGAANHRGLFPGLGTQHLPRWILKLLGTGDSFVISIFSPFKLEYLHRLSYVYPSIWGTGKSFLEFHRFTDKD